MHRFLLRAALIAGSLAGSCFGQSLWDDVSFDRATISGLHLYSVSVFGGYSSFAGPTNSLQELNAVGSSNVGSTATYGAEWMLGWRRERENTSFTAHYSGIYTGRTAYSNLNAFGHTFALGVDHSIGTKWRLSLNGNARYSTLEEYLYQPTALTSISQMPATFDDLAAAFSVGSFSSAQVASMLTGTGTSIVSTAGISTAGRSLLMGDKILSYQVEASAYYEISSRLTLSFSSFTAGGQSNLGNNQSFFMPRTIGANGGATLSYRLSPRTNLGFNLTETRATNQYQGSYGTDAGVTLGRKMGPHWFLEVGAGASYLKITQQISGSAPNKQVTGTGSLGYRAFAHTFLATYYRGTYDSYGLAAGLNTTASGSWSWRRPGSSWSLLGGFGRQQLRDTGFTSLSGWHATAGFSRSLGSRFSLRLQYVYLDSTGSFTGNTLKRTVHTARLSFAWTPVESLP